MDKFDLPFTSQGINLMISFDTRNSYEEIIEDFEGRYLKYLPLLKKSLDIIYDINNEKPKGKYNGSTFIYNELQKVSIRHVARSYMENITQQFIKQSGKCSKKPRYRKYDFILVLDDGQEVGTFVMAQGFLYLSKSNIGYPIRLVEHPKRYVPNKDYAIMQKMLELNKR